MQYYDLKKSWRKVRRDLDEAELNEILVADFNKYTFGRWQEEFTHGRLPDEFESCDRRWDTAAAIRPVGVTSNMRPATGW